MIIKSFALVAAALILSACSGRIIPPSASAPAPRPQASKPAAGAPASAQAAFPASDAAEIAGATRIIPATPVVPLPVVANKGLTGLALGVARAPIYDAPLFTAAAATRALKAFRLSCSGVQRRKDMSGLTQPGDWKAPCVAAASWPDGDATRFFAEQFEVAQIGDGKAFATGYYEPEIKGSRDKRPGYETPVYRRPADLVEIDLGDFSSRFEGKSIRGRITSSKFVPYSDRTQIEEGALSGRGLEIAWVADAIDFFFLQVQGSGRLRLPDGGMMRIGYDSQNGHDYTGIGKLMRERGLVGPGQANIQGLTAWLRANPEQGRKVMQENKSFVFFREIIGPGPLGAMNVPVSDRASVATDPAFIPLGAPVILSMDRAEPNGIWVAQDTGGAIKGSNRFDTYWGGGAEAYRIAGGMAARGTSFLLLPTGVIDRLLADPRNGKAAT
jgi:membrane-bound lytic murein transglycosylase A